jgi:hypothetical protein
MERDLLYWRDTCWERADAAHDAIHGGDVRQTTKDDFLAWGRGWWIALAMLNDDEFTDAEIREASLASFEDVRAAMY